MVSRGGGQVTRTPPVERQVSEVVRPHAPLPLDWPVVIEAAVQDDAVVDRFWPKAQGGCPTRLQSPVQVECALLT